MPFSQINWIAVAIGAVVNMLLGSLWYGPLFGSLWLKLIGKKREDLTGPGVMYILPLAASFISGMVLALIIAAAVLTKWWMGGLMGALVWFGIGGTAGLTTSVFEDKRIGVWLLFVVYQVIIHTAMGIVFVVWQ